MSLQAAFRSAQSALATNAFQTATVSRNINNADAPGYARRLVLVDPSEIGSFQAARVSRATDHALQGAALDASAVAQSHDAVSKALEALQAIVGNPADQKSPSARLSNLKSSLLAAGSAPQDAATLAAAVSSAKSLASTLSDASARVQDVRAQADRDMATSVANINALLQKFQTASAAVAAGRSGNQDISDALDQRDAILGDLSKEISISTVAGPNGDLSIYTDSGVALFQGAPRTVSMEATTTFAAGSSGKAVYIDGVAVTGPSANMPLRAGALAGNARVRDELAVTYQSQLDETAVGLICAFSQSAEPPSSLPTRSGLFTWQGGPAVPPCGANGVAASLQVDPSVERNPALLRDGGIGGQSDYLSNKSGSASYSARLYALVDALGAPQDFQASGMSTRISVSTLATQSESWLENARQRAGDEATNANAVLVQTTTALSNAVGVNIDDQMSKMLDLENSYQASAKMMATVDSMYAALFNALQSAG